ncbi:MAG: Protoheme IX farnesyltransferase [Burkholderiaceae bacterium]|nr:Protoheme IX farnesyltransferase [Burkholderiaceae bacterium]
MNTVTLQRRSAAAAVRQVLSLFKLRIGVVIAVTALGGVAVQPGSGLSWGAVAALFGCVLLASAAAGAFNQWWEVDLDRTMRRTRGRPFATGALQPHAGWLALMVAMTALAGLAAWAVTNAAAAVYTVAGALVYAVVYTVWLKRRTWWNIVIGGLAGSFAVLAGAAAVNPELSLEAWLLTVVLFLWTPPHFWSLAIACRDDYAAAAVPMLPVVKGDRVAAFAITAHALALALLGLALGVVAGSAVVTLTALLGGGWFVIEAVRLQLQPTRQRAMRSFFASLAQLTLLLVGVMLAAAVPGV